MFNRFMCAGYVALSFIAVGASACPVLSGTFSCVNEKGESKNSNFSTRQSNKQFVYTFDALEFAADGSEQNLPDSSAIRSGKIQATCELGALITKISGDYWESDKAVGRIEFTTNLSLDQGQIFAVSRGRLKKGSKSFAILGIKNCSPFPAVP